MKRWFILAGLLIGVLLPSSACAAALVPLAPASAWDSSPIYATAPPGDPRLFVVERDGGIRIFENNVLRPTPFLTVPNVDTAGERGLLSIAFDPNYSLNGLFYVFTVAKAAGKFGAEAGELQVVEYKRSSVDPNLADPESSRLVLGIPHGGATNHNGGQLAFGPDGFLYITVGDAANGSNAQTLSNDLGKVLRIDPSPESGVGFEVPPSNPFVGMLGALPEVFALGLRNPFRASFAPNGALVIGDVGESTWEEIDAGDLRGANLGWPNCEGICPSPPPQPGLTDPVFQYGHGLTPKETTGCAVLGGYVVRDQTLGALTGRYLYGDLCRPDLRTLDLSAANKDPRAAGLELPHAKEGESLRSFGEDSGCGVYVLSTETAYRVAMDASSPPSGSAPLCAVVDNFIGRLRPTLRLRVSAAHRQKLRGIVKATASCSEACSLRARGKLLFFAGGKKAGAAKLGSAIRFVQANAKAHFRLAVLKVRVRKRAKRALKHGRKVAARVTVRARNEAGETAAKTVRVTLTR